MKSDLLSTAMLEINDPEVLVNMVSKRVRQLGQGYRPMVPVDPRMSFMDVALKEIAEKKLAFQRVEAEEDKEVPKKGRAKKKRTA